MAKMETLIDSFATNDLATLFNAGFGTVTWSSGQVAQRCDSSYDSALISSNSYDLTASYLYAEIIPYVSSGATCNLMLGSSTDNVTLTYTAATIQASITQASSFGFIDDTTYNATSMAWWRIREASGTIYFETSPDGTTWTTQFTTTHTMAITSLPMTLNGGGASTAGNNVIKNINTTGGSPPVAPKLLMAASFI
jgi:hypothetical protein